MIQVMLSRDLQTNKCKPVINAGWQPRDFGFLTQKISVNFVWRHTKMGTKYMWGRKNCDFQPNSHYIVFTEKQYRYFLE